MVEGQIGTGSAVERKFNIIDSRNRHNLVSAIVIATAVLLILIIVCLFLFQSVIPFEESLIPTIILALTLLVIGITVSIYFIALFLQRILEAFLPIDKVFHDISPEDWLFYEVYRAYRNIEDYYEGKENKLGSIKHDLYETIPRTISGIIRKMNIDYVKEEREKLEWLEECLPQLCSKIEKNEIEKHEVEEFFNEILPPLSRRYLDYDLKKFSFARESQLPIKEKLRELYDDYNKIPLSIRVCGVALFITIIITVIWHYIITNYFPEENWIGGVVSIAVLSIMISGVIHHKDLAIRL